MKLWAMAIGLFFWAGAASAIPAEIPANKVVVATREAPPFSLRDASGAWRGISIDLWEAIARQLGLSYEYREMGIGEMLAALEGGQADVAVAALTVTSDREARVDFSHPFHTSGLGMAVNSSPKNAWTSVLHRLFSARFFTAIGGLLGLLALVGVLVWLMERRRNPQFGGGPVEGIGSGLWWSAVTMTTVGYGDKAPATFWGRGLALVWMFASIIVISSFTAAITAALTLGGLEGEVRGVEDLARVRVLTVADSTSERFLQDHHYAYRALSDLGAALRELAEQKADTLVYDRPILAYRIAREYPVTLAVLPVNLKRQDYGLAVPSGTSLRELLNRQLLQQITAPGWQATLDSYLGANR